MAADSLLRRCLGAVLLVVVLIGALLLHPLCYAAVFSFGLAVMMCEFYSMSIGKGKHILTRCLAIILAVAVFAVGFFVHGGKLQPKMFLACFPLLLILLIAIVLDKEERIEKLTAQDICFPLVYLLPSFMVSQLLMFDRKGGYTPWLFIAVMLLVWASDVGAYAIGMAFGQKAGSRKLAPHISPNKSWAGMAGSLLFCLATAAGIYFVHSFGIALWQWLAAALMVSVFGIFGDLFESLIKRHYGFKDSGGIVIGHGGLLDRFDAALFAVPAVTVFFALMGLI